MESLKNLIINEKKISEDSNSKPDKDLSKISIKKMREEIFESEEGKSNGESI